jgi:hypothetical protein
MAEMNVFTGDAFNTFELTDALNNVPYVPSWLGSLKLFQEKPIRTNFFAIEQRDGVLSLVQTSQRGAPLGERGNENRNMRLFPTVRIAKGDRLNASEIQGIRAFGSESELQQMQEEALRRMVNVRTDVLLTHEYHMLGAVQGIVLDADGTTTIRNWFTEFGISQPAEIDFNLDAATADGSIRTNCAAVIRATARASKGTWVDGQSYVVGLCSDTFFDALIAAPETRQTYLNQQEANQLRENKAFLTFSYGGILFVNYRGTDDNSTVAVPTNKCKFFPVNCPGVFQVARSPGESFEWVNTPGQPFYAMQVPDLQRNMYVDLEVYSYPLYVCTKPAMLQRAKLT